MPGAPAVWGTAAAAGWERLAGSMGRPAHSLLGTLPAELPTGSRCRPMVCALHHTPLPPPWLAPCTCRWWVQAFADSSEQVRKPPDAVGPGGSTWSLHFRKETPREALRPGWFVRGREVNRLQNPPEREAVWRVRPRRADR